MPRVKDLEGKRFGRLVVIKRAGSRRTKSGPIYAMWLCQRGDGNGFGLVIFIVDAACQEIIDEIKKGRK